MANEANGRENAGAAPGVWRAPWLCWAREARADGSGRVRHGAKLGCTSQFACCCGRVHLTAFAAFVLFVVGEAMEVSVPNVVWDKSIGEGAFGADTEGTSEALRAIVSGAPLLGHVIGGIAGGVVADTHGRRAALCVQSTVFVLSSLASALNRGQPGFVATRIAPVSYTHLTLPTICSV